MSAIADRRGAALAKRFVSRLPLWRPGQVFVILTAFLDEAGTHAGSPITVMAGVLGTANQWRRFEAELTKLKSRYGFEVFHTKQFKARSGEFRDWSAEKD